MGLDDMSKRFEWLQRRPKESLEDYENRINRTQPQHVGYAFFDGVNYDAYRQVFATYVIWSGDFDGILQDALPQGGFEISCDAQLAEEFCEKSKGYPVFIKLFMKTGKLYARELYIIKSHNRIVPMQFTACQVAPPQQLYFRGLEAFSWEEVSRGSGLVKAKKGKAPKAYIVGGSRGLLLGSRLSGSGRMYLGSRLAGSGRLYLGSRLVGSGRWYQGSRWTTSRRGFFHEYEYEYGIRGSYASSGRILGRGSLFGSRQGSYSNLAIDGYKASFLQGSHSLPEETFEIPNWWEKVFGIGGLGYGLDLI